MEFDFEFARNTSLIKQIGKIQLAIDPVFKAQVHSLRLNLYRKKVTGVAFWEQYKKILLKSTGRDKKILQAIIKKTDSKLKQQFKEAEKEYKEKPLPDLRLPE